MRSSRVAGFRSCYAFDSVRSLPILLLAAPFIVLAQPPPDIPKVWNEEALKSMTTPLAGSKIPIQYAPADWYYQIPERTIYRGYPVYHPTKEPRNYMAFLQAQQPAIVYDSSKLKNESDGPLAGRPAYLTP